MIDWPVIIPKHERIFPIGTTIIVNKKGSPHLATKPGSLGVVEKANKFTVQVKFKLDNLVTAQEVKNRIISQKILDEDGFYHFILSVNEVDLFVDETKSFINVD